MTTPTLFDRPTASQSMKSNKEKIRRLMREFPELRNNDTKLCTKIWRIELRLYFNEFKEDNFFFLYETGSLTEAGIITRLARMIRNEEGWKKPKKEEEELVKQFVKQ